MMIYHEFDDDDDDDDDDDFATIDYQMVIHDESDDFGWSDSGIILVLLDSSHFMGIWHVFVQWRCKYYTIFKPSQVCSNPS